MTEQNSDSASDGSNAASRPPATIIVYHGKRTEDGVMVTRRDLSKRRTSARPLTQRQDLRNHSPTGFEWGYGGSGPAQLALALLADALKSDEGALRLYQDYKWEVVARLNHEEWLLSDLDVQHVAHRLWTARQATANVAEAPAGPAAPTP